MATVPGVTGAQADTSMVIATRDDLAALASTLSASFADDPVQQWLFAGAADVDAARDRFFRFFTDEYFSLGHAYVPLGSPEVGGALWAPPDREVLQGGRVDELVAMVVEAIGDETFPRLTELARAADYKPKEPHWYLGILGVAPGRQGRGDGARFVAPILEQCDRSGLVAHLESSNPRNLGFYRRLGFESVGEYRCGGDGGPLMTIMTRPPR